jgi:hypothetical protein
MDKGYLHGLHDPGGEHLMEDAPGWILFTEKLGDDPNNKKGPDYSSFADRGFKIIARLNRGYGGDGTIPQPDRYEPFALRCGHFVGDSKGCHTWIVGNEPNHPQEWPGSTLILPSEYGICYTLVEQEIHRRPGHEHDLVLPAPIAPWCNKLAYKGNERGDWVQYFVDALAAILRHQGRIDGIALHAYTHGHDPKLITDMSPMGAPFTDRLYNFRCYRDFLHAVPEELRALPAFVTEANPTDGWQDANNGWVLRAYEEVNAWNALPDHQQIRSLILYRWWKCDRWYIEGKQALYGDIREAVLRRFTWTERGNDPAPSPPLPGDWEARTREIVRGELDGFRKDLAERIAL